MSTTTQGYAVRTISDVEFSRVGDRALLMDLHLPKTAPTGATLPVVLFVHGGGWRQGARANPPLAPTAHGYAVASIDYRLSTEAPWPAQIEDCRNAVRFVKKHADRFGLDADRVLAWGKSAGGHLVAMLAVLAGVEKGDDSWHVRAVADYCGPSDLTRLMNPDLRARFTALHEVIEILLGGALEHRLDLARHASPLTHVSARTVPTFIAHGALDNIVPVEDSQLLYEALRRAGADTELHVMPDAPHALNIPELDRKMMAFFDRVLNQPKVRHGRA